MPNNYFRDPQSPFSAPQMEMPEWVQMPESETPDMSGVFQGLKERMQSGGSKANTVPLTEAGSGKAMPSMSGKAGGSGGGGSL